MRVVIAGGSGFLGRPLVDRLVAGGHDVVVLSRRAAPNRPGRRTVAWSPDGTAGAWAREIDGASAVINLAGEGIADKRWTPARKRVLYDSRILSTRSLVSAIAIAAQPPRVFLNGSAVGIYGDTGDRVVDESSPAGHDFLARLCVDWEAEARAAETAGCRVTLLRTGIVLGRDGGALEKMALPFRLFAGGPIGSGRQVTAWIHADDWVALAAWLLHRADADGPFNLAAPHPVSNRELSTALGRALHRPSFLPAPAFALRLALGEMADGALLIGQRAVPKRALDLGFQFRYSTIDAALEAIFTPSAVR